MTKYGKYESEGLWSIKEMEWTVVDEINKMKYGRWNECDRWIWTFGRLDKNWNKGLKQNSSKKKVVSGKTLIFVISSFCIFHSICLNIGYWQSSFLWRFCVFNVRIFYYETLLHFCEKCWGFSENLFQS